ncbi:MAG: hypothetical protein PVJ57_05570 [Phycisphaerae bacterium]|jgi:hypothetical protein
MLLRTTPTLGRFAGLATLAVGLVVFGSGCALGRQSSGGAEPRTARAVVVVAPVVNLSGSPDLDTLKLTDMVASELQCGTEFSVVPVNLALAALQRRGEQWVSSPESAIALARDLGADATLVTAVTEYQPYEPLIVGLIMQWYEVPRARASNGLDPVAASREAWRPANVELSADVEVGPAYQVQRVFNAADEGVLAEVRDYAKSRGGHESPHGWRKYVKVQELYFRYCTQALIKPIHGLHEAEFSATVPSEVGP